MADAAAEFVIFQRLRHLEKAGRGVWHRETDKGRRRAIFLAHGVGEIRRARGDGIMQALQYGNAVGLRAVRQAGKCRLGGADGIVDILFVTETYDADLLFGGRVEERSFFPAVRLNEAAVDVDGIDDAHERLLCLHGQDKMRYLFDLAGQKLTAG